MQNTWKRGDYCELAELLNIVLGGTVRTVFYAISLLLHFPIQLLFNHIYLYSKYFIIKHLTCFFQPLHYAWGQIFETFFFCKPGAYHHTRFMGKSIYILKMFLLSHLFDMSAQDKQNLEHMVEYVILIYARNFLQGRLSTAAPRLDLSFWYELKMYGLTLPNALKRKIVDPAIASCRRHLWYLCPAHAILGIFDRDLSPTVQQKMAEKLISLPRPDEGRRGYEKGKPGQPNFAPIAALLTAERPCLSDFVTPRSWLVFDLLDIPMQHLHWLTLPPSEWENFQSFRWMRDFLENMAVVNDYAERAVKNVGEFAHMTRKAGDRDEVILVGNDHRGRVSGKMNRKDLRNING